MGKLYCILLDVMLLVNMHCILLDVMLLMLRLVYILTASSTLFFVETACCVSFAMKADSRL